MNIIKKIISLSKSFSFIFFPFITFICTYVIHRYNMFKIDQSKISVVISIASSLIGVVITAATLFVTLPKNKTFISNLKSSGHYNIYLRNMLFCVLMFVTCIIVWLLFDINWLTIAAFISGIECFIISTYYTLKLIDF